MTPFSLSSSRPVARPFAANNMSGFGAKLRRLLVFTEKRFTAFRSNLTHAAAEVPIQERPARFLSCWLFHITTYFLSWGKRESNP